MFFEFYIKELIGFYWVGRGRIGGKVLWGDSE